MPNLGDVITTDDILVKGTGKYSAKYVNWARVAHLLHEHASGWQFEVVPTPDGSHVWKAPDETAYVVGRFRGPDGEITPDFPQAVMDHKKGAVKYDKVTARLFTDTHRRCMATSACAQFGLAWQLWAREEVENPHRDSQPKSDPTTAASVSDLAPEERPLSDHDKETCKKIVGSIPKAKQESFLDQFRKTFNLSSSAKVAPAIQAREHMDWIQKNAPVA